MDGAWAVCAVLKRCGCDSRLLVAALAHQYIRDASVSRSQQRLVIETAGPPVAASVSHDGNYTAIFIATANRVGVDIEFERSLPTEGMAARYFNTSEVNRISGNTAKNQERLFFELWTLKEAHGKLLGEGIVGDALRWNAPELPSPVRSGHLVHAVQDGRGYALAHMTRLAIAVATEPPLHASVLPWVVTLSVTHDCSHTRPDVEWAYP